MRMMRIPIAAACLAQGMPAFEAAACHVGETIDPKWIESGTWEVDIANTVYPAIASLKPLFDPENKKIKV